MNSNQVTTRRGRPTKAEQAARLLAEKRSAAAHQANVTRVAVAQKNKKSWSAYQAKLIEAGRKAAETRKINQANYVAPICNVAVGNNTVIAEGANTRLIVAFDVNNPIKTAAMYEASLDIQAVRSNYKDITDLAASEIKVMRWGNYLKRYSA